MKKYQNAYIYLITFLLPIVEDMHSTTFFEQRMLSLLSMFENFRSPDKGPTCELVGFTLRVCLESYFAIGFDVLECNYTTCSV